MWYLIINYVHDEIRIFQNNIKILKINFLN